MMRRHARERGFTLLEVLMASVILSIGALGVLGLVMTSMQLNSMSRNFSEGSLVGQWKMDRLQVVSGVDPDVANCTGNTAPTVCRANGVARVTGTGATVTLAEIAGRGKSGGRYQVSWQIGALPPASNSGIAVRAVTINVYWPKNRDIRSLDPGMAGFLDCIADDFAGGGRCKKLTFNNYRR